MSTSTTQILVPRGGSWGRAVASDIRARGGDPLIAPLVDFAPPEDPSQLQAAFEQLRRGVFDWLTVTSASTVRVMTRWNAQVPRTTSVAAVGRATATALASAGYRVALVPEKDHSAHGMLNAWPANTDGARVLALGSASSHPTLAEGLQAAGCDVTVVAAYRTVSVTASPAVVGAVHSGRVGAILLTSGSVAREVAGQFGPLPEATLSVAIGDQTALDARAAGIRVDAVTADHSATALAARAVALLAGDTDDTPTSAGTASGPTEPAAVPDSAPRGVHPRDGVRRAPAPESVVPADTVAIPVVGTPRTGAPAARTTAAGASAGQSPSPHKAAPATRPGAAARIAVPPVGRVAAPTASSSPARPATTAPATPATAEGTTRATTEGATPAVPTVPHPTVRPRRLRTTPAMRRLVAETRIHPAQLILPMFVREGATEPVPIDSMPGVVQHSLDSLRRAAADAADAGIGGVMLFGVPERRDPTGSAASDPDGILNVATRAVAAEVGDALVVQTDLCLDEFTDHGHCGVLDAQGRVDNDATLIRYAEMAIAQADAGSQLLGLSGMMDGQVAAVRAALDVAGHADTAILGYAAKYASAFYGPFREAVDSQLQGDRRTYQQDPANRREGRREAALDRAEGADIIMVKPAMAYLDVLADVARDSDIPVWAYQVSGEYAMICAAGERGWVDRDRAIREAVTGILRAGADAVLTYAAIELSTEQ